MGRNASALGLAEHASTLSEEKLSSNRRRSRRCGVRSRFRCNSNWRIAVHHWRSLGLSLRTVSADVSSLTTSVASLASLVQRTTIWSRAVPGDVPKFTASVALHCLRLAIPGEMIGSAALVAHRRTIVACESTSVSTSIASSCRAASSTSCRSRVGIWAVALHVY